MERKPDFSSLPETHLLKQKKLSLKRQINIRISGFLIAFCSFGFVLTANSQPCNCAAKFSNTKKMFEEDYSGFSDKVHRYSIDKYNRFVDSLFTQSKRNLSENECFLLVKSYLQFFKDNHSGLSYQMPAVDASADQIKEFYKEITSRIDFSEQDYLSYLNKSKKLQPIEGVWNLGPNYRIAFLSSKTQKKQYDGIVVSSKNKFWFPGDVKLTLRETGDKKYSGILLGSDHSPWVTTYQLIDENKLDDSVLVLYKTAGPDYINAIANNPKPNTNISGTAALFKSLSPFTALLQITSFDRSNKKIIDSIVGSNWGTLTQIPNLIIDIRNNGGGQDYVYDTLLSLAYTNEILNYDVLYRASPENIAQWRKRDKNIADSMEKYAGGFYRRHINNRKHPIISANPRQIVILCNRNVGSTAEQFILHFKQSGKVTVIGENTSGTLDYGEPKTVQVPCTIWNIRIPTSKHGRLPEYSVDANGITPDVVIPAYETDWIDYTRRFLEKRIGPGRD